jgi:hypothetical protein
MDQTAYQSVRAEKNERHLEPRTHGDFVLVMRAGKDKVASFEEAKSSNTPTNPTRSIRMAIPFFQD